MSENFEDRPIDVAIPEVADDDSPERSRYPEIEEPALPSEDTYQGVEHVGTTVREQIEGESMDDKLGREVPDDADTGFSAGASTSAGDKDAPVGTIVEPDEGGREDTEKDLVATEAESAPSTAEELAVRTENP